MEDDGRFSDLSGSSVLRGGAERGRTGEGSGAIGIDLIAEVDLARIMETGCRGDTDVVSWESGMIFWESWRWGEVAGCGERDGDLATGVFCLGAVGASPMALDASSRPFDGSFAATAGAIQGDAGEGKLSKLVDGLLALTGSDLGVSPALAIASALWEGVIFGCDLALFLLRDEDRDEAEGVR